MRVAKSPSYATPGTRFGQLTILGPPAFIKNSAVVVVCECDCGSITAVSPYSLKVGHSTSCGCGQRAQLSARSRRHGECKARLYRIWNGMIMRCTNPRRESWPKYRGRGIAVCQEWLNSYEAFRDWAMANGYDDKLEIDRINTNGNYDPGNCRWATEGLQSYNTNKRGGTTSTYRGVSRKRNRWAAQIQINGKNRHIGAFATEREAAQAYDNAAVRLYGANAILNLPPESAATHSVAQ